MEEENLSLEPLSPSAPIAAAFVFFGLSGVRQKWMMCGGSSPAADTQNYFYLLPWLHCHMLCFHHMALCSDRYGGCMSVNGPFYSMFVHGCLMSLVLFFISKAELVMKNKKYKHSQPGCTGKYKTHLENGCGGVRPAVSRMNRELFGPQSSEHLKFCAFVGGSFRSCALHGVDWLIVGTVSLSAALLAAILHYSRRN